MTRKRLVTITRDGNRLKLVCSSKAVADDFGRMSFYSRLLHSLKPDPKTGLWTEGRRLDVGIKGWSADIEWDRTSPLEFFGALKERAVFDRGSHSNVLNEAVKSICGGEMVSGRKMYSFEIGKDKSWNKYRFYAKGRSIAALCVLYDLQPHPRNDLEITIPPRLSPHWKWPLPQLTRVYGDPSKTADVLRNEGWSRTGDKPGLSVFRDTVAGARQQMYQLATVVQNRSQQVMRTNVPSRWKKALYASQDHTCRICGFRFPEEQLAPDHRVPVICQADELTEQNFKDKLMTLCCYCNQQKREMCKRFSHDYDWENSPWSYPEKFALKKIRQEIKQFAAVQHLTQEDLVKLLRDILS